MINHQLRRWDRKNKWITNNRRRCELMERDSSGSITDSELDELEALQRLADERVDVAKPRMLEGADEIIADLKSKGLWEGH